MGTQTPTGKTQPLPTQPRSVDVTGSLPARGPDTISSLKLPEKKMPLGPSGLTIFGVIAIAAIGTYLYLKAPSSVAKVELQKYNGFETNMELASPTDCRARGCMAVYLTTDKPSEDALPGAVALADELKNREVETVFVLGRDHLKNLVKMGRGIRRANILLDPNGDWARAMDITEIPTYIVYTPGAKVRKRAKEALSAADVASALGL